MSDEKQKSHTVESEMTGMTIPEINDISDLNRANLQEWISDRSNHYADILRNKYSTVKDQYPDLHPAAVRDLQKKFKDWPDEIDGAVNELFDIWEMAIEAEKDTGEVASATFQKMNGQIRKLNNYFANIERLGIVGPKADAGPEMAESFEESHFKILDEGIKAGRDDVARCTETFELVQSSIYKELYNENFLRRLTDFAKRIGIVEGWLNQLEQSKDLVRTRLLKEKLSDEEVQKVFDDLAALRENVKKNIEGLKRGVESVNKDVEKGKEERNKLVGRIDALVDRIEERGKKGFFGGKDAGKRAKFMIERLNQMKGKSLDLATVKLAEREAEETIFAPEESSDEKKEKMDIQFFWKSRVLNDQKRLDAMIADFNAVDEKLTGSYAKKARDASMDAGSALFIARERSDFLLEAIDSINTAKEMPLVDIKFQLEAYKEEYPRAEKLYKAFNQSMPEVASQVSASLRAKLMGALSETNKNFLSPRKRTELEGWKIIIDKTKDVSLEELNELSAKLDTAMEEIDKNGREYLKGVERKLGEEAATRKFMAGEKPVKEAKPEFQSPRLVKHPAKEISATEEEFFGGKAQGITGEPDVGKAEVVRGIREMLEEQGVIDLEPEKILSILTPGEINSLINSVREDIRGKNDSNRDIFERTLRSAINERLLHSLDLDKREKLCEAVSAQTYSLIKGAVEAESQKELAKLQSGAADKLAWAGKTGARLAANVGVAAGIGIGAGLVIGSGGAAAAVAGAAIGLSRIVNKAIAKSEIFQAAKEKAASFWDKTVGKIFKKEKPPVDAEKVLEDAASKVASPEIIAAILSNQLRENSSQDLLRAVNAYGRAKADVMRKPSVETVEKFELSLDESSKEFYKKAYDYLSMQYKGEDVPEETLARMALEMTLNLSIYQRNEVKLLETLEADAVKSKLPEEKYWIVDKMEKFMKVRSEGVGAVLFGGGLAYAVAETSSAGRVVSGALAGAGLGLMLEKRTRKTEKEKLFKVVEDIINRSEKKLFGKDAIILPSELVKAKKDAANIRAQIDSGAFESNKFLLNRAENFIVRVNQEMMKTYEAPRFSVDDLLADVSKHSKLMEKETAKIMRKTMEALNTKDRALAYMAVGALAGGAAGYLSARIMEYFRTPEAKQIVPTEIEMEPSKPGFVYAPFEKIAPPESPLEPLPSETPLEPIPTEGMKEVVMPEEHVIVARHGAGKTIGETIERSPRAPHSEAVEAATTKAGRPLEVHEVYRASIHDYPNKEPIYFTRAEERTINELTQKGDVEAMTKFMAEAKSHGRIYEDLKTGKQYHADELSFTSKELYTTEEVYGKEPAPVRISKEIVSPYDEPSGPSARGAVSETLPKAKTAYENPYDRPELVRPKGMPESDYDKIMANIPEDKITEKQYQTMIDIYTKTKANSHLAEKYIHYIEQGEFEKASAIEKTVLYSPEIEALSAPGEEIAPAMKETQIEEPKAAAEPEAGREPSDEEISGRAREEVEAAKAREAAAEDEEAGVGEDLRQEAEQYTRDAELRLVHELKSAKAREAYDWLSTNETSNRLTESEQEAVHLLKDSFVKDMIDDGKISKSLMDQIKTWQNRIRFEL